MSCRVEIERFEEIDEQPQVVNDTMRKLLQRIGDEGIIGDKAPLTATRTLNPDEEDNSIEKKAIDLLLLVHKEGTLTLGMLHEKVLELGGRCLCSRNLLPPAVDPIKCVKFKTLRDENGQDYKRCVIIWNVTTVCYCSQACRDLRFKNEEIGERVILYSNKTLNALDPAVQRVVKLEWKKALQEKYTKTGNLPGDSDTEIEDDHDEPALAHKQREAMKRKLDERDGKKKPKRTRYLRRNEPQNLPSTIAKKLHYCKICMHTNIFGSKYTLHKHLARKHKKTTVAEKNMNAGTVYETLKEKFDDHLIQSTDEVFDQFMKIPVLEASFSDFLKLHAIAVSPKTPPPHQPK